MSTWMCLNECVSRIRAQNPTFSNHLSGKFLSSRIFQQSDGPKSSPGPAVVPLGQLLQCAVRPDFSSPVWSPSAGGHMASLANSQNYDLCFHKMWSGTVFCWWFSMAKRVVGGLTAFKFTICSIWKSSNQMWFTGPKMEPSNFGNAICWRDCSDLPYDAKNESTRMQDPWTRT